MAGLQYFLPRVFLNGIAPGGRLNWPLLRERGCGAGFADCQSLDDVARVEIAGKGPDGGPGMLLAPLPILSREPPRRLGFFPDDDSVRWTQISELLWIAVDAACPPAPADLARRVTHPGYPVELGDGRQWTVPVIRRPDGSPALPRDIYLDAAGQLQSELRPGNEELWARTEWIADLVFADEPQSYNLAEGLRAALAVLAHNYRLGHAEQRVLRLLTSENLEAVFNASVDLPAVVAALEEYAKKNAPPPGLTSSAPGGPGCCPGSAQAAATSTS